MSIIYDALQKTQRSRKKTVLKNRPDIFDIGLLTVIFVLIFICLFAYFRPAKGNKIKTAVPTHPLATPEVSKNAVVGKSALPQIKNQISHHDDSFVFNGVYISAQNKIALINQQEYHVGDVVNGLKIIEINANSVKLQDDKRTLILE